MKTSCLIMASGNNSSFHSNFLYTKWRGSLIWQKLYSVAKEQIDGDVIIVGLDSEPGNTRNESVKNGLELIYTERVIIHEASRPFVTSNHYKILNETHKPSVTFGSKINGCLLYSDNEYFDKEATIIQNFQCFDTNLLKEAHASTKNFLAEEDTCLIKEVHGIDPHIIYNESIELLKINNRNDFNLLEIL